MTASFLVSIDPGLRQAGAAVFENGRLTLALPVQSSASCGIAVCIWSAVRCVPDAVAIEVPQQYPGSPVPRQSVQALEGVVGQIELVFGIPLIRYKPRQWKGQVPKKPMFERILARLYEDEADKVPELFVSLKHEKSKFHHAIDAVGIGLHHLGRLGI